MVQYCELSPNVSIPVQAVNNAVLSNNLFGISFNSIHIRFIQNAPLSVALSLFSKRKEGKEGAAEVRIVRVIEITISVWHVVINRSL